MYKTIRRWAYWPGMFQDCISVSMSCAECAKNRVKLKRHRTPLQLFPAHAPLEFVAMDILGPLVETKEGNCFLLAVTDRFSKLT